MNENLSNRVTRGARRFRRFRILTRVNFRSLYNSDQAAIHVDDEGNQDKVITAELIAEAARNLKNRKAPGLDDIPNELIKYGEAGLMEELTKFYNEILGT